MVFSYNGILLSVKKKKKKKPLLIDRCNYKVESQKHMLSERSQTPKTTCYMVYLYEISRLGKTVELDSRLMVACIGVGSEDQLQYGMWELSRVVEALSIVIMVIIA